MLDIYSFIDLNPKLSYWIESIDNLLWTPFYFFYGYIFNDGDDHYQYYYLIIIIFIFLIIIIKIINIIFQLSNFIEYRY